MVTVVASQRFGTAGPGPVATIGRPSTGVCPTDGVISLPERSSSPRTPLGPFTIPVGVGYPLSCPLCENGSGDVSD